MPSGKQILLSVLTELSQHGDADKSSASSSRDERLQAALLFHCSTADKTWPKVANISWLSETGEWGPCREGMALTEEKIFLSDIVEQILEEPGIPESIQKRFPHLSRERYDEALTIIWYLLSMLQHWHELACVEDNGRLDPTVRDRMLENMIDKLRLYKSDPDAYLRGTP